MLTALQCIMCDVPLQMFERETNRVKAADKAIKENKVGSLHSACR
jgi:hypothetical protein